MSLNIAEKKTKSHISPVINKLVHNDNIAKKAPTLPKTDADIAAFCQKISPMLKDLPLD